MIQGKIALGSVYAYDNVQTKESQLYYATMVGQSGSYYFISFTGLSLLIFKIHKTTGEIPDAEYDGEELVNGYSTKVWTLSLNMSSMGIDTNRTSKIYVTESALGPRIDRVTTTSETVGLGSFTHDLRINVSQSSIHEESGNPYVKSSRIGEEFVYHRVTQFANGPQIYDYTLRTTTIGDAYVTSGGNERPLYMWKVEQITDPYYSAYAVGTYNARSDAIATEIRTLTGTINGDVNVQVWEWNQDNGPMGYQYEIWYIGIEDGLTYQEEEVYHFSDSSITTMKSTLISHTAQ